MTINMVSCDDIAPQPWRNGGGRTRELLAWTSKHDWTLRVSVADIDADGPFSIFEGVQRWFAVIEGRGVALYFADGERRVTPRDAPLCFDGAAPPQCRLLDGTTRDLNLMLRGGRGVMRALLPRSDWAEAFAWRALFTAVAGRWVGAGARRRVAAHTLLWSDASSDSPWSFAADNASAAPLGWWLGASR